MTPKSIKTEFQRCGARCVDSATVFVRDVGQGMLEVCHNSLALLGLCVIAGILLAATRVDLRQSLEDRVLSWLVQRQGVRDTGSATGLGNLIEPKAIERATATDPSALPRQQAAIASWLSRRYKVAPEPVSRLVQEAWIVGQHLRIEPTLVLAVMGIESGFNPFAQSPMGAQGLMQVMTRVHDDKYQAFGGARAAFDPITNLRVGVQVLKECIVRAGGVEAGLRHYVGAALSGQDGGYVLKVLAEQAHLRQVSEGRPVPFNVPLPIAKPDVAEPAPSSASASAPPQRESLDADKVRLEQVALVR